MASVDVEDIVILNLTLCDISVTVDFKPITEIQNNLTVCITIKLSIMQVMNLTSTGNNVTRSRLNCCAVRTFRLL